MSLISAGVRRRLGLLTAALTAFAAVYAVTPSPAAAAVLTVPASADAKVAQASPTTNLGTATTLEVDKDPALESFIAFHVGDPGGAVVRARLRLFVTNQSVDGPKVYRSDAGWSETGITWNTRPIRRELLADVGAVTAGRFIEYDVTAAVTGAGAVSFDLFSDSSDGTDFSSREATSNQPQLLIETAVSTTTSTSTTSTSTTSTSTTTSSSTTTTSSTTSSTTTSSTSSTTTSSTTTSSTTSSTTTTTTTPPVGSGVITTFAGVSAGFGGDGGPATSAWLRLPRTMAADGAGNVYIVDTYNHRIRKVDTSGIITTIGGTGSAGYSGDGGPATSARFDTPHGIAADAAGNVYVADPPNQRIRRIDATGIVTTVAGTGSSGFSGDGGPATAARLRYPKGVEIGPDGNLYIADNNNHRVRRVDLSTGLIITVAGSGSRGFSGDGGPATAARLDEPRNIAFDLQGRLYIVDQDNRRIRRVETDGTIRTFASGFTFPRDVAVDRHGTVYVADEDANRIRQVSPSGVVSPFAGTGSSGLSGDGGPADLARIDRPLGVAYSAATHTIYIADTKNDRIRAVRLG